MLLQINEIAINAYVKTGREVNSDDMYSYKELCKIYNISPESWRIIEENGRVLGYIHVEAITEKIAKKLIKGEINENDIKETDILSNSNKDSKGYIHIGSIVLEKYPTLFSNKNLFLIIAGVIDRVIELQTQNKNLHTIIAVTYEDSTGDNHFLDILPLYGFEKIGETKDGNPIFQLDLEENLNRKFAPLIRIVSAKRAKYFMKKIKKLPTKLIKDILISSIKLYKKIIKEPNKNLEYE